MKTIFLLIVEALLVSSLVYAELGSNYNHLRPGLMAAVHRDQIGDNAKIAPEDLASLDANIKKIRKIPYLIDKIRAILALPHLQEYATVAQINALKDALYLLEQESSRRFGGEDIPYTERTYSPITDFVINNASFYIQIHNGKYESIDTAILERLEALSLPAQRIVYKITHGENRLPKSFDREDIDLFIRKAWDIKNKGIAIEVKKALFYYLDREFRTKRFTGEWGLLAFQGKTAKPAQVRMLNINVAHAIEEIESFIRLMPSEKVEELARNNDGTRSNTVQDIMKDLPKGIRNTLETRLASDRKTEVLFALRSLWELGYVPYEAWLLKNHPNIYFLATREGIFENGIVSAYNDARLPPEILQLNPDLPIVPTYHFSTAISKYASGDYSIAEVLKENPGLAYSILEDYGGNWVRAIKAITGKDKDISMPELTRPKTRDSRSSNRTSI